MNIISFEEVIGKQIPMVGVGHGIFGKDDGFEKPFASDFVRTTEGDVLITEMLAKYLVNIMGVKEI